MVLTDVISSQKRVEFDFESNEFFKMSNKSDISFIESYFKEVKKALDSLDKRMIIKALKILTEAYKENHVVYILGNGGSAANASHMSADLSKGTLLSVHDKKEKRLRVFSLTDNMALISAYSNDIDYSEVFVQQLKNLIVGGDILIVISGSGNSVNLIKAVRYAKYRKVKTIGLLGFDEGGKIGKMVDCPILVKSNHYGPVEDVHLVINHLLTSLFVNAKSTTGGSRKSGNNSTPFRNY